MPCSFEANNTYKAGGTALISDALEPLVGGPVVKRLPSLNRWKLQEDNPARLPIALVHLVSATPGKVTGTGGLKGWLYARHELLVARRIADLDIKDHVRARAALVPALGHVPYWALCEIRSPLGVRG